MKREVTVVFCLFAALLLLGQVIAITGSIGNARMILRLQKGEEIEKYILVKNVNDVPLTVELSSSGDLADYIKIKDNNFELDAGEEKKAYFTIKAAKSGTTTTKINVVFTPEEESGVGLSSTIIVLTQGESSDEDGTEEELADDTPEQVENADGITGASIGKLDAVSVSFTITGITLTIFIILLIVYFSKTKKGKIKPKKRVKKSG